MKRLFYGMMLSVFLFSGFQTLQAADNWTVIKSHVGNFQAILPGEVDYSASKVDTEIGQIDLHSFSVEANEGNVAYFVFYSDYPEGTDEETDPIVLLQNARDGVVGEGSRQTREEKIQVGDHPGLEFDFVQGTGAQKTYGYWRLYVVKNRLYQIGIISIDEPGVDHKIKTIYGSFDLLN
ncbi:MAG: hypothetical protein P8M30_20790 [Planctomycetaceae bacterium]|jgi:hypothetical protein|nr:hypothetical protein [Planctomycetaceae bacterium]MDC0273225.1 hypothetical protein [Planctomycetaceae bacterium]MDG2391750.1 hypothetical protein [Planctomycetaceae bacterium]